MIEHKHAEMLRALAEGNEIEYLNGYGEWRELAVISPPKDVKGWRVKPELTPNVVKGQGVEPELVTITYSKSDYEIYKSNSKSITLTADFLEAMQLFLAHAPEPRRSIWKYIYNVARSAIEKAIGETKSKTV
jgi:hypothetical protein